MLAPKTAQDRIAEIDPERHHIAAEPADLHILRQRIKADVVAPRVDPARDRAERRSRTGLVEPRPEHRVLQGHAKLLDRAPHPRQLAGLGDVVADQPGVCGLHRTSSRSNRSSEASKRRKRAAICGAAASYWAAARRRAAFAPPRGAGWRCRTSSQRRSGNHKYHRNAPLKAGL